MSMRNLEQDTILSAQEKVLLRSVKETVRRFVPDAEILLYGSVARGDRRPHSDFDFLVLTKQTLSHAEEQAIEDALYDVQLLEGVLIVTSFQTKEAWASNPLMPFHQEVEKDAVLV